MITEGDVAPEFELPAVVEGEFESIALSDFLGESVVVLAFYPGDFNPLCTEEKTGLDDLDIFTMQKDVAVLGISGDSRFSHQRFAAAYDLHVPLLSDVDAAVAGEYGVAVDDPTAGYQTHRAVVVIDPKGDVTWTWQTDSLEERPDPEAIRSAVESVGGSGTDRARYRIGHAHYIEGRRAFTSAMESYGDHEWLMAEADFARARDEFEEAADSFDSAARFGEDNIALLYYEEAEAKADSLWQAADWLAKSANEFASGEGMEAESLRADAEAPLTNAQDIAEPPPPDDFPPDEPPEEVSDEPEERSILPSDAEQTETSLDADIDEEVETDAPAEGDEASERPAEDAGEAEADTTTTPEAESDDETADAETGSIDEQELEEITAELEEQTAQAEAARDDPRATDESAEADLETAADEDRRFADETSDAESQDEAEEDIELDLKDPTEADESADDDGDDGEDSGADG